MATLAVLTLTLTGAVITAEPATAAPTATVMVQTQKMTGPTLNTTQAGWYAKGSVIALSCYQHGQKVKGYYSGSFAATGGYDDLWYKVSDGYWVADVDINTGSNNPVTGACGAAPAPVVSNVAPDQNRWYTITPRVSGLRLDVKGGSSTNGTPLQQYSANGSKSQMFRFVANGDGTYRAHSALNGSQVWDVSGASKANGAKVLMWSWGGGVNQKWVIQSSGSYVTFKPAHITSNCLDVSGGSKASGAAIQSYACNGTVSQQYTLTQGGLVNSVAGACNAYSGAKTLGTYNVAGWVLPVCGPRPNFDGAKNGSGPAVAPYPGAATYAGYQCVELSARWLYYKYNAVLQRGNGAQIVKAYKAAYPSKFTVYNNGAAGHAPQPGDVISLSGNSSFTDWGHTGVVISSSVNSAGNGSILVAEENYGGSSGTSGQHTYSVTGWRVQYAALPYIQWLRAN